MRWQEALKGINDILTEVVSYGKGKIEIHITPRGETIISVAVLAGKRIDFEIEKASVVEED